MKFLDEINKVIPRDFWTVQEKLSSENLSLSDVATLLSEEASSHLEEMANAAHALTLKRFGRTIKLYAPVYISNSCINGCLYCGFNHKNNFERTTLTVDEAIAEAEAIISKGHRHILLVAGEDPRSCPVSLIKEVTKKIRPMAAEVAIEVQPFSETEYRELVEAGADGVTLYQETYNEDVYRAMHPFGPKMKFSSRLEAIENAAKAGMRFLGIGALLGLSDWRVETLSLIAHARYLMKKYWQSSVTVSIPRIRDAGSNFKMPGAVSDRDLVQMICVLRLALPDCGISLSTRESAEMRDNLLPLGITKMSAGSVTSPGGYTKKNKAGSQFHLEDDRSPDAISKMLIEKGYEPVWKDWNMEIKTKKGK